MANESFRCAPAHAYRRTMQRAPRGATTGAAAELERACHVLRGGGAVVVPNPAPMAYGLVATTATAINALKGRALDQPVAVSLHDRSEWQRVAPSIDVPPPVLDGVVTLLNLRISLLVPVRSDVRHPSWLAAAVRDGYLGAFNGRWPHTATLWDRFPRLFGSSANVTGEPPAACAAQARAMFGTDCVVVDAPAIDGKPRQRLASTMVRLDRFGRIAVHRSGSHDALGSFPPGEYLRRLSAATGLPIQPGAES